MDATSSIQAFDSQVGGHPGILTTENGSLLIKPTAEKELEFYQKLQQDSHLEGLRVFTPTFLGTLKLQGKLDETRSTLESIVVEPIASEEKDKLVLSVSQFRRVVGPDAMFFFIYNPLF